MFSPDVVAENNGLQKPIQGYRRREKKKRIKERSYGVASTQNRSSPK
jgi:hypothetical protein